MTYFFVFLLQAVLPIGLLLACMWATSPQIAKLKPIIWCTVLGLVSGLVIAQYLPNTQILLFFRTNVMLCVLLGFITCQVLNVTKLHLLWQFFLSIIAGIQWGKDPNLTAITHTDVINTDFILNITAILGALVVVLFLACLLFMVFQQIQAENQLPLLRPFVLLFLLIIILIPLIGDLLLSMMKLQVIDLTKIIVSLVAKSTLITDHANYLALGLQAVVFFLFFTKISLPRKQAMHAEQNAIEKRKKTAQFRIATRTLAWGCFAWLVIASSQLYWDQVASRPPQLSEATPVTLGADGNIHLPIESFKDNKLHRFIWHTADGKSVRFFIINRLPDKFSLGVVFDACLLCGDQGYVMQGNQVVCIGCGVYMFTPSIGKPGGCNPVPIENWQQTDSEVLISKESLEAGLPLFTTNYAKEE